MAIEVPTLAPTNVARQNEELTTHPEISSYCLDIIQRSDEQTTRFEDESATSIKPFSFGKIGTFTLDSLAKMPQDDGTSALDHLGLYRLGRYLRIGRDRPIIWERGFFSWTEVAREQLITDPDLEHSDANDLAVIAFDDSGHILGHLHIEQVPEHMRSLPLNPKLRKDRMEIELIHGDFLSSYPIEMPLSNVRILSRLSRVSRVPGVPKFLQSIAKAKITTHIIAGGFGTTNQLKSEGQPIQAMIFDGEKYATDGIRTLGLEVTRYPSDMNLNKIPPILYPRYVFNNNGPVVPHIVDLKQLDNPKNQHLYEKIEQNHIPTFLHLLWKHFLLQHTGRLLN